MTFACGECAWRRVIASGLARFAAAAVVALTGRALAGEAASAPLLRLDPGVHSAPIGRIDVDAKGRWLVTASDDRTARVWDLRTGAPLRVLRPPLAEGKEGQLWAVAISPDGRLVAAAGATGRAWTGSNVVYVFDRATGRLLHRIEGFPEALLDLTFSRDGRWLAAGIWGPNGIRVFRTRDFAQVGQDAGYTGDCYSVEFDADGRLVASSYDGFVRLYQMTPSGLAPIARLAAPGGKRPAAAAFSPDGRLVAVGYNDTPRIDVLDGRTLEPRFVADTSGLDTGGNLAIAWSGDGGRLYAGGSAKRKGGWVRIRTWLDGGRGGFNDLVAAGSTIADLRTLPGGQVAFSSYDPAWGILDASGTRTRFVGPPIANYADAGAGFALSADGAVVRFGYDPFAKSPARFDARARMLTPGADATGLAAPQATGIDIRLNAGSATLEGRNLDLQPLETSFAFAVAPGGGSFALATDWWLRVFDRKGQSLWAHPVPGIPAWAVNISGDGRLVVAAFGDGTIRWYRLSDGKELLAFFPHADRKRWVLWTPSGYYDASLGGEDLVGWHVNRGPESAGDFFPASRFRQVFHRPDVVSRVLDVLDEDEALRAADLAAGRSSNPLAISRSLPPVVEILSPGDGAPFTGDGVKVKLRVRAPANAPARALRIRVNGRNVAVASTGDLFASGEGELLVPVLGEDSEIQVFAENRNAWSAPATVRLAWAGASGSARKPVLYVFAVGVSHYRSSGIVPLSYAHKDAEDFQTVLRRQEGGLYRKVEVRLLSEDKATRDEIMKGLAWLRRAVSPSDVGVLFFSGHGDRDADQRYYYLPVDADPEDLLETAVSSEDFKHVLSNLSGKAVFFLDSCRAGALAEHGARKGGTDITPILNELMSAENGVVVYASSTGRQTSWEDSRWGNGAFTKAVVEGLSGKAADANGRVTHLSLGVYVSDRVKELTNGRQHPVPGNAGVSDFPIAAVAR